MDHKIPITDSRKILRTNIPGQSYNLSAHQQYHFYVYQYKFYAYEHIFKMQQDMLT